MSNTPAPFDPDTFRQEGYKTVDILAGYLADVMAGKDIPVFPANTPDDLVKLFSFESEGGKNEEFGSFMKRIISRSIHIHHPRYIGHQVTSPLPLTALAHLCTSLLNNGAAIYEMGPVNMAMERNVVMKFGSLIGYRDGYDGIFTHGGTAGNLTAMLAARQAKTDYNIWEEGVKPGMKPGYMMSEQSHYSIGRNVKIMSLGEDSVVRVPHDSRFMMRTDLLEDCLKKAEDRGIRVIAVAVNACSTATGTYDDLCAIADFCEKHNLWMHVDGAHGMGILFSEKYRHLAAGIERADSIVIDFHKMFLVPALNTLVMFKNADSSFDTFAQKASYLFQRSQNNEWYNSATRTIECTKSAIGIIAYTALKYYSGYYREYINSRYDLTTEFARIVKNNSSLELATEPQSNIVCFRYSETGKNDSELNIINSAIRKQIVNSGRFYIVQAELNGKIYLRLTIINPLTDINQLVDLLSEVVNCGKSN